MALPSPGVPCDVGDPNANVACPVCNVMWPQNQIEEHVNLCLISADEENARKRPGTILQDPPPTKRLKTDPIPATVTVSKEQITHKQQYDEYLKYVAAIHKAIIDGDEKAALKWMVRSKQGGVFPYMLIAQRLVRAASEDIGLADSFAMIEAVACLHGCQGVGMPGSEILLTQCIMRLARAPKSREVYNALTDCKRSLGIPVANGYLEPLPPLPQGQPQGTPIRNGYQDIIPPLTPVTRPLRNGNGGLTQPAVSQDNNLFRKGYHDVIAPLTPTPQPLINGHDETQLLPAVPQGEPYKNAPARLSFSLPPYTTISQDKPIKNGHNQANGKPTIYGQTEILPPSLISNGQNELNKEIPPTSPEVKWVPLKNGFSTVEENSKPVPQDNAFNNQNDEVIVPNTAMPLPFRTDGHDYEEVIIIDDINETEKVPPVPLTNARTNLEVLWPPEAEPKSPDPQMSNVYSELMALEQRSLVVNLEPFECGVCMDACAVGDGAVLRECAHAFCRPCLADLVRHSTEPVLACPETGCVGTLQEREVRSVVSAEQYEAWLSRGLAAAESGARHAFHCRTRDCVGWALVEPPVTKFPCPICQFINCVPCEAIHENETCEMHRARLKAIASTKRGSADKKTKDMIDKMIAKGEAMECPGCGVVITKASGCDWMQCAACKIEICWATRGPRWGPKGRGDTSGGCRCRFNKNKPCDRKCRNCH